MLASLFGFKGRVGRLRYFLTCLAFGPALVIASLVLMLAFGLHPGAGVAANFKAVALALVLVAPIWLWTTLSLQTCRIRDIGWSPLLVILGWIGLGVLDRLAAMADPALSIGPLHQSTAFGLLLNLAFPGVLLFWPGKDGGRGLDARWEEAFPPEPAPQPVPTPRVPALSRPATTAPAFGRRGL